MNDKEFPLSDLEEGSEKESSIQNQVRYISFLFYCTVTLQIHVSTDSLNTILLFYQLETSSDTPILCAGVKLMSCI